jgi:RNA polymerase sigma-70 factor (ECF subfamily)
MMDDEFWQSAYQKHGAALIAYFRVRIPDRTEAEDLMQETFVKAIRASDRIADVDKLPSYLFAVAHNLLVNRLRKKGREVSSTDGFLEDQAGASTEDPEASLAYKHFGNRLQIVLKQLNANQRLAFEMAVILKEPYDAIADKTGWSLSNVKVQVYRARKKVIEALGDVLP